MSIEKLKPSYDIYQERFEKLKNVVPEAFEDGKINWDILKEAFAPFILSLIVLTGIMLLGNLVKMVNLVINKGVDLILVLKSFLYFIPYLLAYTVPIACLFAILLAFSRLSSDNEIGAIRNMEPEVTFEDYFDRAKYWYTVPI